MEQHLIFEPLDHSFFSKLFINGFLITDYSTVLFKLIIKHFLVVQ